MSSADIKPLVTTVSFLRKPFLGDSTYRSPPLPLSTALLGFLPSALPRPNDAYLPSVCQQFLVSGRSPSWCYIAPVKLFIVPNH